MLPKSLLISLFAAIPVTANQVPLVYTQASPLTFHLRHVHVVTNSSRILFADVPQESTGDDFRDAQEPYTLMTRMMKTHRPSSFAAHARARMRPSSWVAEDDVQELSWGEEDIVGPDITCRESLLHLAKMSNNAYALPDGANGRKWYDPGDMWNAVCTSVFYIYHSMKRCIFQSFPFGWEDDDDGFRGHVFTTDDNSTVVISIKGTSAGFFGGGGPTAEKDKLNDNLLFSCCCARVGITWSPVCGCHAGGWKCDRDCLESSLIDDSLFYPIGIVRDLDLIQFSLRLTLYPPRIYITMCPTCTLTQQYGLLAGSPVPIRIYSLIIAPTRPLFRRCISFVTGCHIWSARGCF